MQLSDLALRVLGVLIEKEMATPQSYPLSVNALTSAANQTTNRDPVTAYTESEIGAGLRELTEQSLVTAVYARRSSTPKYAHQLDAHLEISRTSLAVLAVLMLRGPQTVGELRQRCERLHHFGSVAEVSEVLGGLATHVFGPLAVELPRQPGQKETRWRHLLGGAEPADEPVPSGTEVTAPERPAPDLSHRGHSTRQDETVGDVDVDGQLAELRTELAELHDEVDDLRQTVEDLRAQLDRAMGT